MHLEGKLHTGYLKIRNKLAELKKVEAARRSNTRDHRERSRSPNLRGRRDRLQPPAGKVDGSGGNAEQLFDVRMIFSSRKLGSGSNMPRGTSDYRFSNIAIQQNMGYPASGAADSGALGVTSLGREWRYYKKELDSIRRKAKREAERKAE